MLAGAQPLAAASLADSQANRDPPAIAAAAIQGKSAATGALDGTPLPLGPHWVATGAPWAMAKGSARERSRGLSFRDLGPRHAVCFRGVRAGPVPHLSPMDHRVLIADDDPDVRRGAAELLSGVGLDVLEAEDGEQALVVVQRSFDLSQPLHLVLADVHMPPPAAAESDRSDGGLALFSLLRGQAPELPCILWSGEASDGVANWALREGASAFLRKPVQPRMLRDEICRVLDQRWGTAS